MLEKEEVEELCTKEEKEEEEEVERKLTGEEEAIGFLFRRTVSKRRKNSSGKFYSKPNQQLLPSSIPPSVPT